jgi:hypothetical protein
MTEEEEAQVIAWRITVARRILESGMYSKDTILKGTDLTEEGCELTLKRLAVMDCARKLCRALSLEFIIKNLELSEEEQRDIISYRDKIRKKLNDGSDDKNNGCIQEK